MKNEESIQFLKDFQKELKAEKSSSSPRFWIIIDYKWEIAAEGEHDRIILYDPDQHDFRLTLEEYAEQLIKNKSNDLDEEEIEDLKFEIEYGCDSDLLQWIADHDSRDFYPIYQMKVSYFPLYQIFISKKEGEAFLKHKAHHYTDEAHLHELFITKTPKSEMLFQILSCFDWDSIHKE